MLKFVPTATTGIVQSFGRFTGVATAGLNFYIPVVQRISLVDNRLQQEAFSFEVKTSDDVFTTVEIKVQYRIRPENSERAFFSLEKPKQQIDAYIENVVRAKAPSMTLNMLYQEQNAICESVSEKLSGCMEQYGYTIENTLITSIDPAPKVKAAMNAIYESERLKVAAKNEADAHYIKEVRQAEADKERKRLQGEGISEQRQAIIAGYEHGVNGMASSLGISSAAVVDFVLKTQHLDTMEAIGRSPNTKTIFLSHQPSGGLDFVAAQEVKEKQ
jgi:regulator of protease activity HflC (stomatin/prohibitin superfamily)